MFRKILIANRGEIACRVAATARRLGIRTVAVYSEADAQAQHVRACDEAVRIGGPAPKDSYLRIDRILQAAEATGAEAVHPGYGFLSENDAFAQACADAGLVFIGPPPAAIRAMGLKAESKRLMEAAGVPLVPGYHGADQDPALLAREAGRIGYPVLLKASAGGGGKGMRIVASPDDFEAALASCRREALHSFGDGAVLVERYLTRPRHIEIQVFGDAHGHVLHLFERDCSVQRRHQKVLEESPAPGLGEARRRAMGAAAVAAAKAVGYVGAGTVEFIAEPDPGVPGDLRFYFMEMNTRLQVEHPVTEAVTGLDLVEWQLRVAGGEALPWKQDELRLHGHAIEARLCAENPDAQFLPATGRLEVFRTPEAVRFERGTGREPREAAPVRIDAGVAEGDAISPHYDPMIAKLIVWGADRAQALARLDAALAQTHIVGLHTNVAFLRRVVATRSFSQPTLDTALIEREHAALFEVPPLPVAWAVAGAWAHRLHAEQAQETVDPWSRRDGWRLHGSAWHHLMCEVDGQRHTAALEHRRDGRLLLSVDGQAAQPFVHALQTQTRPGAPHGLVLDVTLHGERRAMTVYGSPHGQAACWTVFADAGRATVQEADPLAGRGEAGAPDGSLRAPMPGKVVAVWAQPGQQVRKGQALAVVEAMKMEHTLTAPRDGTVAELLYGVGDAVAEGAELLRLAAE